jgi:hypothetical protein
MGRCATVTLRTRCPPFGLVGWKEMRTAYADSSCTTKICDQGRMEMQIEYRQGE